MKGPLIYYEIKDMYGSDLSSTKLSNELRQSILDDIELGFNVEVDFKDVRTISVAWANNALGMIVKNKGKNFFKNHILVTNMNKVVRKSVLKSVEETLI